MKVGVPVSCLIVPVAYGGVQGMRSKTNRKAPEPNVKRLEDYEPGITREEFLTTLRKAAQPIKKPSVPPAEASSKT